MLNQKLSNDYGNKLQTSDFNPKDLKKICAEIKGYQQEDLITSEEASKLKIDILKEVLLKKYGSDIDKIDLLKLDYSAKSPRYQIFISYSHDDEKWKNILEQMLDCLGGEYLFNWNNIPGDDSDKLIYYLKKNIGIDWANAELIKISEDKKIIEISNNNQFLSFKLTDEKTRAILNTSFGRTNEFNVKSENNKLKIYDVKNTITYWDDSQIKKGADWEKEIQSAMDSAKVAVLLVSNRFFSSSYIREVELPYLKKASDNKELVLLWIAVGDSMYQDFSLSNTQAVNDPSKPLNKLNEGELDTEWKKIYTEIKNAAVIS
jgi:hypothetical protein